MSPNLDVTEFLVDPPTIREWNIQGLPSDGFSTENGIIVTRGSRWPLVIDPQCQATKWIKNMEAKNVIVLVTAMSIEETDFLAVTSPRDIGFKWKLRRLMRDKATLIGKIRERVYFVVLTQRLQSQSLRVIDFGRADFTKVLEQAIQFGKPVLLENIGESLDPILSPILQKAFVKSGETLRVFLVELYLFFFISIDYRLFSLFDSIV